MIVRVLSLVVVTAAVGCATAPIPSEKLAATEGAARAAEEFGANEHPEAQLYLKLAQEQLDEAKSRIERKDMDRVPALLARAQADAELALELSKSIEAKEEAERLAREVAGLRGR
jgi:hypothetical protein